MRDRQPQQSVLLRGLFQGSVLLGIKHVSLFCFPFSAGFSHLPNGLYPSYIPLSHLEPPSAGSPLLAQLGQHSLFESQKGESGMLCALPIGHPWVLTLSFGLLWMLEYWESRAGTALGDQPGMFPGLRSTKVLDVAVLWESWTGLSLKPQCASETGLSCIPHGGTRLVSFALGIFV